MTTSSAAEPFSNLVASAFRLGVVRTLVRRDYLVSRSYRAALVLDLLFGVINLMIYFFISRTFQSTSPRELAGAPTYFAFASVGVALNLVVQVASIQVMRRVREEQLTGTLEAVVAQPITPVELSFGLAGFHYFFAMGRALLYIALIGTIFRVDLSGADWPAFLLVLIAAAFAMSAIGIALAAVVLLFRRADAFVQLVVLALGVGGGAFFPVGVLPGWLQPVARILPTRFVFRGVRSALFGGDAWQLDTVWLLLFSVLAVPVAIAAFGGALELAKRQGSLATY
jgi:ABC-2 type transport system permease protein